MARLPTVAPSAARIGQLRGNIKRGRAIKAGAKKAAAATGAGLLNFLLGFLNIDYDFENNGLGIFGKALGKGAGRGGGDDSLPVPTMEKPTTISRVSNPTITTIEKQLDSLAQTANKIGMFTKEQQVALLNQIQQKKRVASEGQLEQKNNSIPELPDIGASPDLVPLDQSIEGLIKKLDKLGETVDRNSGGGGAGGGLLGGAAMGLGAAGLAGLMGRGRRGPGPRPVPAQSPLPVDDNVNLAQAGRVAKPPGALTKAGALARGLTSASVAGGGASASMAGSSKVAGTVASGFKNASRRGRVNVRAALRKVAGPVIRKALGNTVLKSIPVLGPGVGAAFAIERLLKGDPIGAGVELASGTAGPLTAVPALGATVLRDSYSEIYGVQPEQDPQFMQRSTELKSEIDNMIREQLSQSVTTKTPPTTRDIETQDTPANPPQAAPAGRPPPVPNPAPTPAGTSGTSGVEAVAADSAASPVAFSGQVATPTPLSSMSGQAISPAPTPVPSTTSTGEGIAAYKMPVSDNMQNFGYSPSQGTFTQQTSAETRAGRQGIGQIPSPIYDSPHIIELKKSLFFGY